VQHAGSDLDRLMRVPELGAAYGEMLRRADAVMTHAGLVERFIALGVRPEAVRLGPPNAVPPGFTPDAAPLTAEDVDRLAFPAPEGSGRSGFFPGLPTIGMYGKPGDVKGTYDLIAALGMVAARGLLGNLLLLTGTGERAAIDAAAAAAGIGDRTWILPFLPHWRVPGFIRACTATRRPG
jgi:hypothetical protein